MGRFFDDGRVAELAKRVHIPLEVWNLANGEGPTPEVPEVDGLSSNDIHVVERSESVLEAYTVLQDLAGEPLVLLGTRLPRDISASGRQAVTTTLIFMMVMGVALLAVLWVALQKGVVVPLAHVTRHIERLGETGDLFSEMDEDRNDELGLVAREMNRMQRRISRLTHHDHLTGLPNRALFMDRADLALKAATRGSTKVAFLFVDLDYFKSVNDTLGHSAGDVLLCAVASRLERCLRGSDTISRFGGDEFVILLNDVAGADDVIQVCEKLLEVSKESWHFNEKDFPISASIGISLFPDDGEDEVTLVRMADTAMYQAKESGRNRYCFFDGSASLGEHGQGEGEGGAGRVARGDA